MSSSTTEQGAKGLEAPLAANMGDIPSSPQPKVVREYLAYLRRYGQVAGALTFYVVMMAIFIALAPTVFTNYDVYAASWISLPTFILVAVPEVFIITAGEIDLSFPGLVGMSGYLFALLDQAGVPAIISLLTAVAFGIGAGLLNAGLVVFVGLPALVVTLGMMFFWEGLISVLTGGNGIATTNLEGHAFYNVIAGTVFHFEFPVQMLWAIGFGVFAVIIFGRHRFGIHVSCVGDNIQAAREMGINVRAVKTGTFVFMGLMSALTGVLSVLIDNNFYSTTGQALLLPVIAAVFVGGTPPWGGAGTVAGAILGACTVTFIDTGLVGIGVNAYWTQVFYGVVIVVSVLSHRFITGRSQV